MGKERLDLLLVEKGFFPSREQAKDAILSGLIQVGDKIEDKPGTKIERDAEILVKSPPHPYVSRGGLKLEKAIEVFRLDLKDKVVLDIGASTGGFTDCALQHGAKIVYAIDVGYGQLAWKLRNDKRVIVMERVNFRHLKPDQLQGPSPHVAVIDVSFISLTLILSNLTYFFPNGGEVVALVKPQFEAGRENVGKKGVIRDPRIHLDVLKKVVAKSEELGYTPIQITHSPVKGGEGNIEFLLYLQFNAGEGQKENISLEEAVRKAHQELDGHLSP
ncbi:putative methyltransferase with RNA binding domain [[Clostridium] ultunense Esp]|nr:putative methyltransferase with RNA binding domain [[Clostridium] ultunense Esp]